MPTGPGRPPPCQRTTIADRHRSAECPAGVEPACPVWKTDAWAARPRALRSAEGEGVEPSRLVARPGSSRVPSPVGLPFRLSVWMAGFEPAWSGVRGRRMKPGSPTSRFFQEKRPGVGMTPGLCGFCSRTRVTTVAGAQAASMPIGRAGPPDACIRHGSRNLKTS